MRTDRWANVETSQVVYHKGLLLKELVINVHASDGYITVYDGLDATSGRSLGRFYGQSKVSTPIDFPDGLRLERGLYIELGDHADKVLVVFDPFETVSEAEEA